MIKDVIDGWVSRTIERGIIYLLIFLAGAFFGNVWFHIQAGHIGPL